jgi:HEAT repeat protein
MVPSDKETSVLIAQLQDPSRSNQALLGLLAQGREAVPALAEFLRSTKPSTVAEGRLLAVEGLSILKGEAALNALIEVATKRMADIPDPAVRLAEESVVSRAARALADFSGPRVRETLLKLLEGTPLVGVAEALEKLKDSRAIPRLIAWLEDDFVAHAAGRAVLTIGRPAVPALLASLSERQTQYGAETRTRQRRRARVLEILEALIEPEEIASLQSSLEDPAEGVRWNAANIFVRLGNHRQQRRGIQVVLSLLDTSDSFLRADCEELLTSYYEVGQDMIEKAIQARREKGESEIAMLPRETTLEVLLRIQRRAFSSSGAGA